MRKSTNVILWVLQVLLAAWVITGAQYMARHAEELVHPWAVTAFPWYFWSTLATLEILFALGLIIPGAFKILPKATSFSAVGLAILFLLGIVFFIGYSTLAGAFWGILPAVIALFIAYKRWPAKTL